MISEMEPADTTQGAWRDRTPDAVDDALISSPHVSRQSRVTVFGRLGTHRGRRLDPAPWAPLRKPLAECRLALVASSVCLSPGRRGGYTGVPTGDPGEPIGNPSFRTVDGDVLTSELPAGSRELPDASDATLDRTLACALDRLREAVSDRRLGELNRRHLALCGAVAATGGAIRERAPQAALWLTADRVDVALLVPT